MSGDVLLGRIGIRVEWVRVGIGGIDGRGVSRGLVDREPEPRRFIALGVDPEADPAPELDPESDPDTEADRDPGPGGRLRSASARACSSLT